MASFPGAIAPMTTPRLAVLIAFLALPAPAFAGGIGLVTSAGGHSDRVWSYDVDEQLPVENQLNANYGGGLEIILGDRDNKILGIFRGYYILDSPEHAPTRPDEVAKEDYVYSFREEPRGIGLINAGIQWGIAGEPSGLQFTVVSTLGAGIFTDDLTEFLTAEVGPGATWMAARQVQLALSVTGGVRYRKHFYPQGNAYLGVRYLFD